MANGCDGPAAELISLSTGISTANSAVASLSTGAATGLSSVNSAVASLSTSTSSMSSEISATSSAVASLSTSTSTGLSTLTSNVASLSTVVSTTAGNTDSLSTALSNTNSAVASLSTTVSSVIGNTDSLSTALSNTNSSVASLSTVVSSTTGGLTSLSASTSTALVTTNSAVASLSTGLSSTNEAISSLSTTVSSTQWFPSADAGNTTVVGSDSGVYTPLPPDATTTLNGLAELATDAEAIAGVATDVVLTPSNLAAALAAAPISADVSKLFVLNASITDTPAGSVPRTVIPLNAGTGSDPAFMTFDNALDTITFAAHTKSIIVELTANAVFSRLTGATDIDAGICLKDTVGGFERGFIYCQGRNAGEDNVQASGTAMFELLPGDTNRTFKLTAITQASGTWRVIGLFASQPGFTVKVTKL